MCGMMPPLASVYSCVGASLSKGQLYVRNFKPQRQCTYNVTLRRVRALLKWKSNKYYIFWVWVCSLSYPTCSAHAPYYIVIRGLSGSTVSFYVIVSGRIFVGEGGKLLNTKCVF